MLRVRKLQESDWEFLPKWWKAHGQEHEGKSSWLKKGTAQDWRDFLPGAFEIGEYEEKRSGLGGFLVCEDTHPIAAMWLNLTNSGIASPTSVVSDPSYRDKNRKEAIQLLLNFVTDFARDLGYKYSFGWAEAHPRGILDRYLDAGYQQFKNPVYELIKKL